MDHVNIQIEEMKINYPNMQVEEEDKDSELAHTASILLYTKKHKNFEARYGIGLIPAAFACADIYIGDNFQYNILTCSGELKNRLKYLEKIVGEIDEKGLDKVKHKFDGERIGMFEEKSLW